MKKISRRAFLQVMGAGAATAALAACGSDKPASAPASKPASSVAPVEGDKVSTVGSYSGYSEVLYDEQNYERHSQYVTVSDGTKIAVDYYIPTKDGVPATEPMPTIFHLTPYDRVTQAQFADFDTYAKDGVNPDAWGDVDIFYLLRYGYTICVADVRGTGASYGCRITTNSRREAQDGAEIIEWIASQPWSNGKVGTTGYSYTGQTQMEMISMEPEHLIASTVGMTDYDKYDGWIRGGVPRAFGTNPDTVWGETQAEIDAVVAEQVAYFVPVDDDPDRVQLEEAVREHMGALSQIEIFKTMPWRDSNLKDGRGGAGYVNSKTGEVIDMEIWNEVSASLYKENINNSGVAMYNLAGNYDVFRRDSFIIMANTTVPKKLLSGTWYHMDMKKDILWRIEQHRWFDYWLKGIDNGIMDEPAYAIKVGNYNFETMDHQGEGTGELRFYDAWPVDEGTRDTLYLSSGMKLTEAKDAAVTAQPYDSVYGIKTSCETALTTNDAGTGVDDLGLVFNGEVLAEDYEIIGHPMMYVDFSLEDAGWMTENYDIDMFITLSDYDPATGKAFQITDGHIRTSLRATAEPTYDFLGLPWHENNVGSNEYLELGEKYSLEIDLMPAAYVVKAGHQLRVTISNALDRMYYLGRDAFEANPDVKTPDINVYLGENTRIVLPNIYA